ncbi:MAG TPA: TlpA disulfide reductase family protein [Methylocella sp.]|nr:TlpA disulfide reductase family protein [Methylocella sp.]
MTQHAHSKDRRPGRAAFLAGLFGLLILGTVLYVSREPGGKEEAGVSACSSRAEGAARLKPLVHGEIAALMLSVKPKPLSDLSFTAPDGTKMSLSEFKGRTVLLNLWATWCVPCRTEMPALDRLQGLLGAENFTVVAINVDTAKLERPKAFFGEAGIKNLTLYADSTAAAFQSLKQAGKALGLPTTILIGKDGCEIGTMAGPARWDSPDALALLKAAQG